VIQRRDQYFRDQPSLFDQPPAKPLPEFDGQTFDYDQDFNRLSNNLHKVAHLMIDGRKRTLHQIAAACGCGEAGASARLRDLRKPKFQEFFGRIRVEKELLQEGVWLYWIEKEKEKGV
jgi:hypothetical protein